MPKPNFVNLRVYVLAEHLSDEIWKIVLRWNNFARDTVGKQIVRAADSIGANLAEGVGRRSFQENRRFIKISRASLNETQHWLRRSFCRGLVDQKDVTRLQPLIQELGPKINSYLKSIGPTPNRFASVDNGQRTTDNGHS